MTQQQQPLYRRRFFPLFRNFTFLVFGRGKKNVWRLTTLKRTMTNMTNTQIRPKRRLKHHSGREIGGSFTFRDSASFLRFSHHVRIRLRRPKSAAHDSIISGADVSIGALFFSYNSRNSRKNGSHPPKSNKRQKYPLASSGHSPVTPGRRPKATAFDSLSHTPRASLILFADVAA